MDHGTLLALLVGLALGGVVGVLAARTWARVRTAGTTAERDLLRQRVIDLEAATSQDRELAAVLGPLRDSLTRVERQVGVLERDRVEQYARLDEQLLAVAASGEALRTQTAALAGALRSSNTRGTWGETQLRRVVEHAGMLARVDFVEQASASGPDGGQLRPDLVVRLPGGKQLVVDSKAPLTAFLDAGAVEDDADRRRLLQAHARALRGHVDVLAARAYWQAFTPTPEMVVCFVPGDAILAAALDADPGLHEAAMARRVVLASPATLLALLRTVAYTWQQDALSGNARELFEVGKELYARLGTLGSHSVKLGRTLHRAVEDYNALVGTLERRVLVTARRMNDLDLTDDPLETVPPVEATPRTLTAVELLLDDTDLVNGTTAESSARRAARDAG
ncbi:DNA recombination protein RmuC [Angustibacter luteus]|uniref:DNA recombination protein RmuC n=1 Tax=Angustibacter luteus TaxID=658456 RepID=A0ABW1JJL7_9ACTN